MEETVAITAVVRLRVRQPMRQKLPMRPARQLGTHARAPPCCTRLSLSSKDHAEVRPARATGGEREKIFTHLDLEEDTDR